MKTDLYVIGIGASAGGLEALTDFISHLPSDLESNACFLVAQHLSPTHRSMLVQILARESSFPVQEAKDGEFLEAGKIYITPPDSDIQVSQNKILLSILFFKFIFCKKSIHSLCFLRDIYLSSANKLI